MWRSLRLLRVNILPLGFTLGGTALVALSVVALAILGGILGILPRFNLQNLLVIGLSVIVVMMLLGRLPANSRTITLTVVLASIAVMLIVFR